MLQVSINSHSHGTLQIELFQPELLFLLKGFEKSASFLMSYQTWFAVILVSGCIFGIFTMKFFSFITSFPHPLLVCLLNFFNNALCSFISCAVFLNFVVSLFFQHIKIFIRLQLTVFVDLFAHSFGLFQFLFQRMS